MKIRLGILDKDKKYTSRIISHFNSHYSNQVDIYLFSTEEAFRDFSKTRKIDVLIASPDDVPQEFKPPRNVAFAYFSETKDVETIRNQTTICRYQRADLIFNEIVKLYSELDSGQTYKQGEGSGQLVTFSGAAGGVGTTTVAVSCAKTLAHAGKSVLFIDLEQNGDLSYFLTGEGAATMSDVLYAVKSKRANLGLKLSSMVRQDSSGVCFFDAFAVMLDALELKATDVTDLINAMTSTGAYEYVVVDLGTDFDECRRKIMMNATMTFLVSDGMSVANIKLARLAKSMELIDANKQSRTLAHTSILYNRFGSKSLEAVCDPSIGIFGKTGKFEGGTIGQVIDQIVLSKIFVKLL